ncbi:hypothetical protein ABZ897_47570 [Nonomuraea sp. NPDC046802]|uniref:hypothetical protein n=1 Tax=Nonomuraea sp. NPDC046802 TaxID=3154919 RepID=UPI003406F629
MKTMTKVGGAVAVGAFSLVLGVTPSASAQTTAAPVASSAQVQAGAPKPSIRWLCGKPIVKKFIPACTNGKWELPMVKKARCIQGHAPYLGLLGPSKLSYWTIKCFRTEWQKW